MEYIWKSAFGGAAIGAKMQVKIAKDEKMGAKFVLTTPDV